MRRRLLISSLIALVAPLGLPLRGALAQEPPLAEPASEEPASEEPASEEPEESEGGPEEPEEPAEPAPPAPPAPPPQLAPVEIPAVGPALPDPDDAATTLEQVAPPPVEKKGWRWPETVFHLHGYFRLRAALLKDGDLGHSGRFDRLPGPDYTGGPDRRNYDPFIFFTPADSNPVYQRVREPDSGTVFQTGADGVTAPSPVAGGCGDNPAASGEGRCSKKTQTAGDMRLRLKPEVHLSDDIRVKAWVDVLDNVGLGTMGYGPNDIRDVKADNLLLVRRVWAEARNRDLGELRFGRMAADWGLGILDNSGDRYGIDSDFSSDVDRIMVISNLAGFYLMAAYDWAYQGYVSPAYATPSGVAIDRANKDDLNVITLAAAHRLDPELQQSALQRGESVFNYGLYFVWRDQSLKYNAGYVPSATTTADSLHQFTRFNQKQYIPDLWLQFLWEGLRIELEAAFVAGSLEGGCPRLIRPAGAGSLDNASITEATEAFDAWGVSSNNRRSPNGQCKFRQFGIALESEYRLFDDRLGIYFMTGLATGDSNSYGLAYTNDPSLQVVDGQNTVGNRTVSTYGFHPDYRIDLILWRTIMRRVAGGYYFKPGISYDFIHDAYGQRAGGRLDLIYSRATNPAQTWGDSGNLGLEADLTLYYRSQEGPDLMDGFYGLVQGAVLFPFQGLNYPNSLVGAPGKETAFMFRAVGGVMF